MCSGKRLILAILALTMLLGALPEVPPGAAAGVCDVTSALYWTPPAITRGYTVGTGTTYYVDNENGNDGNSGLSPGVAWKTMYAVNTHSFSPGDSVLFHRGQTWCEDSWPEQILCNGSNGNAQSYILYGAYGDGDRPTFNGSCMVDAQQNPLTWGSGVFIGMYSPSGARTIAYVVFKGLRFTGYPEGGVALTRSQYAWSGSSGSQNIYFDDCVFDHNGTGGLYVEASDNGTENINVIECYAASNGDFGGNWQYGHGFKFSGAEVGQSDNYSISGGFYGCQSYDNQGAGIHCSTGGQNITIQGCICSANGGPAVSCFECRNVTIEYCLLVGDQCSFDVIDNGLTHVEGVALFASEGVTVQKCHIRSQFRSGIYIEGHRSGATTGHTITECTLLDNAWGDMDFGAITWNGASLVDSVSNVSIFGPNGIRHNGGTHCTVTDCAIEVLNGWVYQIDDGSDFNSSNINSNTVYAHFSTYPFVAEGTELESIEDWRSTTYLDASTTWADPEFDGDLISTSGNGITELP